MTARRLSLIVIPPPLLLRRAVLWFGAPFLLREGYGGQAGGCLTVRVSGDIFKGRVVTPSV